MEPLNISIEGLGLDTVIDGDYEHGGRTLADAIVDRAVTALTKDQEYREVHGGLAKRVSQIRDEEIRERVRVETVALVAAALRELLADTPDETQARAFLSEIPVGEKNAVADALISAAATLCGQHALARVKAGADR